MKIEQIKHYDDHLLTAMNSLLPQLSTSAKPLSKSALISIIESEAISLLVAFEENQICGMLTLVTFRIPTGIRAWIEDIVVNESSRGKGIGKLLLNAAIDLANNKGARTLDLTSRPAKVAANQMYQNAGFVRRDTHVYRISF